MKVLVCGGRNFTDQATVDRMLDALPFVPTMVIEGGARRADTCGRSWAATRGIHYAEVPALWRTYHNQAGPLRNSAMLELKPDYCVAFPGGSGTADMVRRCRAAGVVVWEPLK